MFRKGYSTVPETARRLEIRPGTLDRWCREGRVTPSFLRPSHIPGAGTVLVRCFIPDDIAGLRERAPGLPAEDQERARTRRRRPARPHFYAKSDPLDEYDEQDPSVYRFTTRELRDLAVRELGLEKIASREAYRLAPCLLTDSGACYSNECARHSDPDQYPPMEQETGSLDE